MNRQHIRPGDLDSLGHLNHARAIELLELGRYSWIMGHNIDIAQSWLPVVTRIDVRYQQEIFLTEVIVDTKLIEVRYYSVEFAQCILIPGQNQVAVKANIWICFIDKINRHPLRVKCTDFINATTQTC